MNLDIEIPNRNFHELCNVIKWKEAPHTYNKEELQAKSIADVLSNNHKDIYKMKTSSK